MNRACLRPFLLGWTTLAAILFSPTPVHAATPEVVVISPNWDGIKEETSRAFSDWHQQKYGSPATIRWRDVGGGSQILRFLRAEYHTNGSAGVDVLYGAGVDPYRDLKKDGLLMAIQLPADVLAGIPADYHGMELRDPDNQWFGYGLSGFGILTNERVRETIGLPQVREWADLADPRVEGWLSAVDPRASSSVLSIYEIILQAYGWDKGWEVLMAMSGNARNFVPSATASVVEVGTGDAAYGVSIDFYAHAQVGYYGADNVKFILPEGQTVITPDCIAVLKNPPHPELAQHFVEFTLSRAGQLLWMLPKGTPGGSQRNIINRMSILPALYDEFAATTPVLVNPFKINSGFAYSGELGSKRRAILSVVMAACMIDNHDTLVQAWKALNAATGLSPERRQALTTELFTPPCTAEELLHLLDGDWNDPIKRTALVNQWQGGAHARYVDILKQLGKESRP